MCGCMYKDCCFVHTHIFILFQNVLIVYVLLLVIVWHLSVQQLQPILCLVISCIVSCCTDHDNRCTFWDVVYSCVVQIMPIAVHSSMFYIFLLYRLW